MNKKLRIVAISFSVQLSM